MQQPLPWIIAISLVALVALGCVAWALRRRPVQPAPLPTDWALGPRPVFSSDERRVYRQLREALPHHIVLSKLPLVRFCQPTDPQEVRFWYELLGTIHLTFVICSANGRVLAAIDLDNDRANSRRIVHIKQSVLGACRVRYLRCSPDHLPSIPELQLLVPSSAASSRGPQAVSGTHQARDTLSTTVANRRRERSVLWQDSGFFQDSFFGIDSLRDTGAASGFGSLGADPMRGRRVAPMQPPDDIGEVVVESTRMPPSSPSSPSSPTRH